MERRSKVQSNDGLAGLVVGTVVTAAMIKNLAISLRRTLFLQVLRMWDDIWNNSQKEK